MGVGIVANQSSKTKKGRNVFLVSSIQIVLTKQLVLLPIAIRKIPLVLFRCYGLWWDLKSEQGKQRRCKMLIVIPSAQLLLWEIPWCWKLHVQCHTTQG
jgi:hypothetical protein